MGKSICVFKGHDFVLVGMVVSKAWGRCEMNRCQRCGETVSTEDGKRIKIGDEINVKYEFGCSAGRWF